MLCVMRILKTCTYHHVIHSRFLVMAELVAYFLSVLMIRYEKIMLTIMSFTVVFWSWLS